MQHEDIIQLLYKLATGAGATVDLHTEAISIQQGSDSIPNPSVSLANGEVLTADIIIGADGSNSLVREVVLDEEDDAKPGGLTVYTATVKAEDMLDDPELRPLLEADDVSVFYFGFGVGCPSVLIQFPIWMSPNRAFVGE